MLRGAAAVLLAALAGLGVSADRATGQPRMGPPDGAPVQAPVAWIDVHMHLVAGRGASADFAGAVDAAVREMDRFGIAQALILPPPQVETQSPYDVPDYAGAIRKWRGRFAALGGGGTLNATLHRYADPARVTDAVKRDFATAAERILDGGAVGFGELASLHVSATDGHPFEYVPADHPLLRVLAEIAARRDVPIDLHMDGLEEAMATPARFVVPPNPPTLPATVPALERLLAAHPRARIVWAHGGSDPFGGQSPAVLGRLMDAYPNLFVSLRIYGPQAPFQNKPLMPGGLDPAWRALLTRHADRFVLGTDSFVVSPTLRGTGPGLTFAARNTPKLQATVHLLSLLPPDIALKIGRENAIRVYKLTVK